jgi:hypothetical protein
VTPAELLALQAQFEREHPNAPAGAFEVWLDLRDATAPPPPLTEEDVRRLTEGTLS